MTAEATHCREFPHGRKEAYVFRRHLFCDQDVNVTCPLKWEKGQDLEGKL
jgi:hypothetical protein